jgi:hypothetical protein
MREIIEELDPENLELYWESLLAEVPPPDSEDFYEY